MKCDDTTRKSRTNAQPNALSEEMGTGVGLYKRFNSFKPSQMIKVHHSRVMPPVVVQLGELVGLIYRSEKGLSRTPRTYIHFMENPPRLVSNALGTQLYIVGGSYRVSPQGIEG
jgi:hypothetical protein